MKLDWNPIYTQEESIKATILWWKEALAGRHHAEITKKEVSKFIERAVSE